jgi:hypothetical protein
MLGCTKAAVAGQEVEKRAGLFRKNTYLDHPGLVGVDIAAASEVKALLASGARVDSYLNQCQMQIDLFSFS